MENIENTSKFEKLYQKNYKLILIIPTIIFLLSIIYLYHFTSKNGDIIYKDVSLTGGTTITVFDTQQDIAIIKSSLITKFPDLNVRSIKDISSDSQKAFYVESNTDVDSLKSSIEDIIGYKLTEENSSVEFSGQSLSEGFYKQLRFALIVAFILMALVVFTIFRTFVPSAAVIISAFADILMTIALIDFLGFRLSTAGIIALLMLIGYSVDTDILLTTRLLKSTEEGSTNKKIFGAFKTGMTMTLTAILAVGAALIVIYSLSDVLKQMFLIILIGLGFDILNTWITNASLLKWYMEKKSK
jgi:preprotein translocase subunit SecF